MDTNSTTTESAILLIHCPDQKGLVAAVTQFVSGHNGNILNLEQHVDASEAAFFMRVEWDLNGFQIPRGEIGNEFERLVAQGFGMKYELHFSSDVPRMAVFVSRQTHCLYDILSRVQVGEWQVELPLVISNHPEMSSVAGQFGVDFHFLPVTQDNKRDQEQNQLALLKKHKIDFIVLARYMQILTGDFIAHYPNKIINIHHSFLPAFPGARPYHSAHQRGVKIIGVTSHYVTSDLDEGPIIDQDVVRISHQDSVKDMMRVGKDLEKVVLSRTILRHLQRKVLPYGNRTVVFV
ncbi:MAG: formyltetrahydrofolate deformylase [Candidatus Omnitrophica bacterium]|nr:formyltetrahydrofolate deformylase [Candidatus Omnitrophota bacterium]